MLSYMTFSLVPCTCYRSSVAADKFTSMSFTYSTSVYHLTKAYNALCIMYSSEIL